MKRIKTVSKELRESLKERVSKISRPLVASHLSMRYGTLSAKLNAIAPLSEGDYKLISEACDQLEKVLI
jgi:hypothetical protein